MSNIAHFFDLSCLVNIPQNAWVVSKSNPNQPLYKISPSEFLLIKSGIYKNRGNKIDFNGVVYYLPDELWNKLKVISTKNRIDFSSFVISLQEFLNKDLIEALDYEVKLDQIMNLKNKVEDIYVICSKETKGLYEKIINEIVETLRTNGMIVKNFYYLNENFLNQNTDEVNYKKMRLLLQHSIGYRSDMNKFIDDEITKYDQINFYDKSIPFKTVSITVDQIFKSMMKNTDKGLMDVIKDDLKTHTPIIQINKIEDNQFNPIRTTKIELSLKHLITKFESFTIYP